MEATGMRSTISELDDNPFRYVHGTDNSGRLSMNAPTPIDAGYLP